MSEHKQIDKLKKECYDLFKFKDNLTEYDKALLNIEKKVTELKLDNIVEPLELSFLLQFHAREFPSSLEEFQRHVDKVLGVKKISFFFQLPELVGFPDNYNIGYGKFRKFTSLPKIVRDLATGLTKGKVGQVRTERERIQTMYIREIRIPLNTNTGCWLEIEKSGVSSFIVLENALQSAEMSLDILRIIRPHIRISLPQYVISKSSNERKAFFNALNIELYKYHFDHQEQELIDRLNTLIVNPRSELEKRVLNALQFYRIGRNFSPEDQALFYYVAAIENLILGKNDRDVLRWRFAEKAAFLLEGDLTGRLEIVNAFKSLYDARSTIAHGIMRKSENRKISQAKESLIKIIIRILELIDKKGLISVSSEGKNNSLDEYVDQIKYSGKPLM